jgi:hypothetical protein
MLTAKLEDLIWCGKAQFKTFVAGGSERHVLNIENDRFIIITDITYFSSGHFPDSPDGEFNNWENLSANGMNTQVTIGGERGVNRFLFRNNFTEVLVSGNRQLLAPVGNCKINTYLLHTTQAAFTFSFAQDFRGQTVAIANANNYALPSPTDYGRDGQPGALAVTVSGIVNGAAPYSDNFDNRAGAPGVNESTEFSFPVDAVNQITSLNRVNSWAYPILHVNYVEILGLPNNIGFY